LEGPENREYSLKKLKGTYKEQREFKGDDQPSFKKDEAASARLTLCLFFLGIYCSPRTKRSFSLSSRELR